MISRWSTNSKSASSVYMAGGFKIFSSNSSCCAKVLRIPCSSPKEVGCSFAWMGIGRTKSILQTSARTMVHEYNLNRRIANIWWTLLFLYCSIHKIFRLHNPTSFRRGIQTSARTMVHEYNLNRRIANIWWTLLFLYCSIHKIFRLHNPTSFRRGREQPISCDLIYLWMVAYDTSSILQAKYPPDQNICFF